MKHTSNRDKKLRRKQEAERAQQPRGFVKAAQEVGDLLDQFPAFRSYDRNGLQAELKFYQGKTLPSESLEWAFGLCKANMQDMYETVWGWSDKSKLSELKHEEARFLVAFRREIEPASTHALAYIHFRFEVEEDTPVLYVYEIQLERECQQRGLGRLLMKLMELVAFKTHMQAVMLTVMTANRSALGLYSQLGYVRHASCPEEDPFGKPGYLILHKAIRTAK